MVQKILFIFLFAPVFIKAQGIVTGDTVSTGIVYKNINDTTVTIIPKGTNSADFDLDGDNVNDIRFSISQNYSPGFIAEAGKVFSLNNIEIVVLNTPVNYVDSMALNSYINDSLNWSYATNGLKLYDFFYTGGNSTVTGVFYQKSNNYLAFRRKSVSDTLYGWIFFNTSGGITIRSWAYASKFLGVQNTSMKSDDEEVFPNPTLGDLKVNCKSNNIKELKIINSIGQVVWSQKLDVPTEKLTVRANDFRNGIYVVELSTKNQLITKKFIKQ